MLLWVLKCIRGVTAVVCCSGCFNKSGSGWLNCAEKTRGCCSFLNLCVYVCVCLWGCETFSKIRNIKRIFTGRYFEAMSACQRTTSWYCGVLFYDKPAHYPQFTLHRTCDQFYFDNDSLDHFKVSTLIWHFEGFCEAFWHKLSTNSS